MIALNQSISLPWLATGTARVIRNADKSPPLIGIVALRCLLEHIHFHLEVG
jgi:hypothetical protein